MAFNQYIAPPIDTLASDKLGWFKEVAEEGENFLKSQRAWADIDKSVEIISGTTDLKIPRNLSRLSVNMAKHEIRDAVATLANMRPIWGFKTDNDQYQKQAVVLNTMLRAWYSQPFVRSSIRKALQYALGASTGYVSPTWEADQIVAGRGDIALHAYGPRQVLPFGIPQDNDLQKAYVVTIVVETPIQIAMAMHPTELDKMVPDRSAPTWMRKGVRRVQRFMSPLLNMFGPGSGKEQQESPFPTVDIYHSYVRDLSINTTDKDIWMGTPGTNWFYKVPAYKSRIETGTFDKDQHPLYREATREDAMLYPLRRLCKWTKQGILYDNSSPLWHGKVPAVPFRGDDWPWDFLSYPMTRDAGSIQESANRLLRAIDDSANVKLDMPLSYDETAISEGLMGRFNPRRPGQRIKINAQQNDKPVLPVVPAEWYNIDPIVAGMPDKLFEWLKQLAGTRDMAALAKAKQVPSGDSIEKLMELSGPLMTDMSMGMEGSMVELGEQWKGLAFQFYDLPRRVQVMGQDAVTEQDYDYDPSNMIPSHLPDEYAKIKQDQELAKKNESVSYSIPLSRASQVERARKHLNSFIFHVTPNSLHQITQLTKKMLMLQLWKGGFPVDPWTVAAAMDLENYGNPSQLNKLLGVNKEGIPDDIFGRWMVWREIMAKLSPQPAPKGRPGSGQTPPAHQSKDGGTRGTVRESPR